MNIPINAWQWIGDYDDSECPQTALGLATIEINGVSFHVEAIEVRYDDDQQMQVALNASLDERFGQWFSASNSEGTIQTVEIDGREYALFASPYC